MAALTRLAGGIAHEFNNLLTAILATTDLSLASPALEPAARADLDSIRDATLRAAGITRQLIAFSGSQSLALEPLKVDEVIRRIEPMFGHVLPPLIRLELQLSSGNAVSVDALRLEQMLLNLVLNSADASPDGGSIRISTRDLADGGAEVEVADKGRGMDEATLARVYEPFHTTKAATGDGVGLALAMTYGTMRQHGGSVHLDSAPGQGTRVTLRFPGAPVPPAPFQVEQSSSSPILPSEVVLVVEDEAVVRAPLCRSLRNAGYFVLEANNGEDALMVMQEYHAPIHLVITDVQMPEMDGAELVGLLRDWYPRMRVLFISGYSKQYLDSRGGTVDGSAFLAKPFGMRELTARVREILDTEFEPA